MNAVREYDLLVTGDVCCDMIFSKIDSFPTYGTEVRADKLKITVGGIFNVAAAASRLGLRVAMPCVLGTDVFSNIIRKAIRREKICREFVREVDRHYDQVSVVLNYGFERAFVSYAEKSETSMVEEYLKIIQSHTVRALAVCPTPDERILEVIRMARAKGTIIVMDCFWDEKLMKSNLIREQMKLADYFMPNAMEACCVSGEEILVKALKKLAEMTPQPVIKNGHHGILWDDHGVIRDMEAVQLGETIDPTGAGDNFIAGFIYGLLRGYSFTKCLRCGVICGAKTVLSLSGYEGSIRQDELEALL